MTTIRTTDHSTIRPTIVRCVALVVLLAGAAALAACSTTEGFGKDVKNLGGSIEDSAAENK